MKLKRWPKRMSKYISKWNFIDYPFCGPKPGLSLKKFAKIAKAKEKREAWKREYDK